MAITNISNGKKIVGHHKKLTSITSHAKGLMFTRKISDFGLVFVFKKPNKASLHMFFVFYPIDIIWLDEKKKVVDYKERVKPFTPHIKPKEKAKYVVELPAGTIVKNKTKEGDKILWD